MLLLNSPSHARVYSHCPYPQHEVGVGYGYLSYDQFAVAVVSDIGLGIINSLIDPEATHKSFSYIGPINLSYKFFFKERLSIGGSLIFASTKMKYENSSKVKESLKFYSVSVMPRFDFYYIRNPKFALYGNLGLGATFMEGVYSDKEKTTEKGATLAFQFTPIAMRIGREFGVVVELGIGSLGLANAGFSYRHYDRPWGM